MDDPKNQPFSYSQDAIFSNFMQRVYQWMAMGLALTGLAALVTAGNMPLLRFLAQGGMLVFFLAEFGLVIWLTRSLQKISAQAATIGFLVFSVINGVTLSSIFRVYTAASISSTFLSRQ